MKPDAYVLIPEADIHLGPVILNAGDAFIVTVPDDGSGVPVVEIRRATLYDRRKPDVG